ncbi:MAG: histone [Nanobdellota archaeon]
MKKKSKMIVPLLPVKRLMQENTNLRISNDATDELTRAIISKGIKISEKSLLIAKNCGRITIKGEDIRMSKDEFFNR